MVVAYIAYRNLTPQIRARVDQLLKRNTMYAAWTKGVSKSRKGLVAFLHARNVARLHQAAHVHRRLHERRR